MMRDSSVHARRVLWGAIHQPYPGELYRPAAMANQDWERIRRESDMFLVDRKRVGVGKVSNAASKWRHAIAVA
jgi:hypothetical protein